MNPFRILRCRIARSAACVVTMTFGFQAVLSADTVATDPVGFITLSIKSAVPDANPLNPAIPTLTFLGLSLTQPVSYQGALTSDSTASNVVIDKNAYWGDGQFEGTNGTYYLELLSGSGAGLMSNIVTTSGTNKTLTLADDLSAFAKTGIGYRIKKNWTLASVFGPNNEAGLQGGTLTTADEILIYNPANVQQPYTTYYYKTTTTLGGVGWRSTSSTSVDASGAAFKPADGLIIRRHQTGDLSVLLAGAVKLGQAQLQVLPGLNFVANVYPAGNLTLGASNLYNSGLVAQSLVGGDLTTADQVLIYDNSANQYNTYYYKTTTTLGGTGWRSTNSTSADASGVTIPVGTSIIIQRLYPQSFVWTVPPPF